MKRGLSKELMFVHVHGAYLGGSPKSKGGARDVAEARNLQRRKGRALSGVRITQRKFAGVFDTEHLVGGIEHLRC